MWANLIISFVMTIVSYALQAAAAPKPEKPQPGKLDTPTAEEGSNIPVVFGTVIIKSSNIIWYGDARTTAIKTKSGKK